MADLVKFGATKARENAVAWMLNFGRVERGGGSGGEKLRQDYLLVGRREMELRVGVDGNAVPFDIEGSLLKIYEG
ncbi:hypothetical protein Syun_031251 [Stephania yunnanensis]|uniref:Uncharacterized protein n=1 Tax=Stephania yunnanensis TaxID=152371 RepID=A0AAP0DU46_9MAGN